MPSSNSFFTLFLASLNSRIPLPIPRINSGIFLPPNRIKTARIINIHSEPPGAESRKKHCRKLLNIYLMFGPKDNLLHIKKADSYLSASSLTVDLFQEI